MQSAANDDEEWMFGQRRPDPHRQRAALRLEQDKLDLKAYLSNNSINPRHRHSSAIDSTPASTRNTASLANTQPNNINPDSLQVLPTSHVPQHQQPYLFPQQPYLFPQQQFPNQQQNQQQPFPNYQPQFSFQQPIPSHQLYQNQQPYPNPPLFLNPNPFQPQQQYYYPQPDPQFMAQYANPQMYYPSPPTMTPDFNHQGLSMPAHHPAADQPSESSPMSHASITSLNHHSEDPQLKLKKAKLLQLDLQAQIEEKRRRDLLAKQERMCASDNVSSDVPVYLSSSSNPGQAAPRFGRRRFDYTPAAMDPPHIQRPAADSVTDPPVRNDLHTDTVNRPSETNPSKEEEPVKSHLRGQVSYLPKWEQELIEQKHAKQKLAALELQQQIFDNKKTKADLARQKRHDELNDAAKFNLECLKLQAEQELADRLGQQKERDKLLVSAAPKIEPRRGWTDPVREPKAELLLKARDHADDQLQRGGESKDHSVAVPHRQDHPSPPIPTLALQTTELRYIEAPHILHPRTQSPPIPTVQRRHLEENVHGREPRPSPQPPQARQSPPIPTVQRQDTEVTKSPPVPALLQHRTDNPALSPPIPTLQRHLVGHMQDQTVPGLFKPGRDSGNPGNEQSLDSLKIHNQSGVKVMELGRPQSVRQTSARRPTRSANKTNDRIMHELKELQHQLIAEHDRMGEAMNCKQHQPLPTVSEFLDNDPGGSKGFNFPVNRAVNVSKNRHAPPLSKGSALSSSTIQLDAIEKLNALRLHRLKIGSARMP